MESEKVDFVESVVEERSVLQRQQKIMDDYSNIIKLTDELDINHSTQKDLQTARSMPAQGHPAPERSSVDANQAIDVIGANVDRSREPHKIQPVVDMNKEPGNAAQDAMDDEIDLSHYNLRRVEQGSLFNGGQPFADVEYTTIKISGPLALCSAVWPQVNHWN